MNSAKMSKTDNEMELIFDAVSVNESLARVAVAAFVTEKNPTLEEISDVKTAVSEAVTNGIIHGYEGGPGTIRVEVKVEDRNASIRVIDRGIGIPDVKRAMEPLYTTKPTEERCGMGFAFMEAFMDEVTVQSVVGEGTIVTMKKQFKQTRGEKGRKAFE